MLTSLVSKYVLPYVSWPVIVFTLLLSTIILRNVKHWAQTKGKKLPPGPWGVPVLGYIPFLTDRIHLKLMHLGKKYGDVFRLNILGNEVIVLNSYEAIREAYLIQGKQFSGLPQTESISMWFTGGAGIFQEEGELWQSNRRFILHTFRDFGLGGRIMESRVQNVAVDLVNFLQKKNGQPCNVSHVLACCAINVMFSIMFDKQYQLDDPEFQQVLRENTDVVELLAGRFAFLNVGSLMYLLPTFWKLRPLKKSMMDFIKRHIHEHEKTLNSGFVRDYADAYLLRLQHQKKDESLQQQKLFSKKQLIGNTINFMFAGVDTTASTISWVLLMLAQHPEMQEKLWKEIESEVGTEQLPSYDQRSKMPFLEAFLMEIQRYSNIVPIIPFHSTLEETKLGDYVIPKRSIIIGNLWAVHREEKYWPNPELFDPYRFLDDNGMVVMKEALIPFSVGKRNCVGESLARMEIVIFTVAILQKFIIQAPDGVDLSKVGDFISFLRFPEPFDICAIPRT